MPFMPTPWTVEQLKLVAEEEQQYDDLGNPVATYAAPKLRKVYGWAPPRPGTEQVSDGVTLYHVDLVLYLPPVEYAIDPTDRFRVNGLTFEVVGGPDDWGKGPFGFDPGVTLQLRRVT